MENNNINGNPWKGLSSYTYQDAARFYGRNQELRDIASVIKQNAFTTLYGISGAGKTSIINAGLFPLLDKQSFLPIYIRLDHNVGHMPYDMQIIKAVDDALVSIEAEAEVIVAHKVESELDKLWLYFHSHRFWSKDNHIVNPIIFIDQFEEIFTKNDDTENIWSFFNIIDSLQYSTPTERIIQAMESADQFVSFGEEQNFRMVFSMREDFLARLEDYSYNIPALRKNRIGLKPLNGLQALEVILKPRPDMVNRKVALHIISKVVGKNIPDNERKLEATSVDTSILSLFCTELYNYAMNDNKGEITIPLVDLYGGNILEWFYDRNMQILPQQTYVYLENQLLTHSGFRNSVALENLLENGVLQEQLDLLAENRIVRIEDVNHNLRVEFTHDILCKIAKKRKDERDKIEKMKGEKSARRAFTIDNIILLSASLTFLLEIYYGGISSGIMYFLLSLPLMLFLYLLIVQRSIADRNLSYTLWMLCGALVLEGLIKICLNESGKLIKSIGNENLYNSIVFSGMILIPLSIILMPYAIMLRSTLQHKYNIFKRESPFIILYLSFLLIQTAFLFMWDYNTNTTNILYYCIPSMILLLTPFYGLYQNTKKQASLILSIFTSVYSVYIIIIVALFQKFDIVKLARLTDSIITIWVIWALLSFFYAVQYMRQPKQQYFKEYYLKILGFKAFEKYKSFKYRLFSILICYSIFMMGIISMSYNDIIPFITLPVSCILLLFMGHNEFKFTTIKPLFSYKMVGFIVLCSELIITCQYFIGVVKYVVLIISALLIAISVFIHLISKENLLKRKMFLIKASIFSFFLGIVMPMVCLGYNVFNPDLIPVKRVWNGRITSDARNIYFITIENDREELGVMDYSEIIIKPQYKNVSGHCAINAHIVNSIFSFRSFVMNFLSIDHGGSDYDPYLEEGERILSFEVTSMTGKRIHLCGKHFLEFRNKYGEAYVNIWQSGYQSLYDDTNYSYLCDDNKCISENERKSAIVKIFIKELAYNSLTDKGRYKFDEVGNNSTWVQNTNDEIEQILVKCYNEGTLTPIIDNYLKFEFRHLYLSLKEVDYLFVCDKTGMLKTLVLDKLWNKLLNDSIDFDPNPDKAYLQLLSGERVKAEGNARLSVKADPHNTQALSVLCVTLFYNGKTKEMDKLLVEFNNTNRYMSNEIVSFYDDFCETLNRMELYCLINNKREIEKHVASIIQYNGKYRIEKETSSSALNHLAYKYANDSNYNLAIECIEKAISLDPDANYYDSKGEIQLMQGDVAGALKSWREVIKLDPNFYEKKTELYEKLRSMNLISYDGELYSLK